MIVFPSSINAVAFAMGLQRRLLDANWPSDLLADGLLEEKFAGSPMSSNDSIRDANGDDILDRQESRTPLEVTCGERLWRGLRVRVGINIGIALPQISGGIIDYFGTVVNMAARVSALAQGGQTCMTMDAYEDFSYRNTLPFDLVMVDMGIHQLKGLRPVCIVHILPVDLAGREFRTLDDQHVFTPTFRSQGTIFVSRTSTFTREQSRCSFRMFRSACQAIFSRFFVKVSTQSLSNCSTPTRGEDLRRFGAGSGLAITVSPSTSCPHDPVIPNDVETHPRP